MILRVTPNIQVGGPAPHSVSPSDLTEVNLGAIPFKSAPGKFRARTRAAKSLRRRMNLSTENMEKLRSKLRFKIGFAVGFACPDVEDLVQESLARFLVAAREDKIHNPEAAGAFLNGISRNVISEYRRRLFRDEPMPEIVPEPPGKGLPETDLFDLRQAIARGLSQLPDRDRRILRAFYLEEKTKEEIMRQTGLTDQNFRVVLFRAKEKFRAIYLEQMKQRAALRHSDV